MSHKLGISSWAIRNPLPIIIFFVVVTVLGILSFKRLPVNANPSVDYPLVAVTVIQVGAAPAELENNVTRNIENALAGISGVRNIQSTIKEQVSNTLVEFNLDINVEQATNDVRSAISQVRTLLPNEIEEPIVQRIDVTGAALLYYTVTSNKLSNLDLSWFIDDNIIHSLLGVNGVEQAMRFGGSEREISVEVDPIELATHHVSIVQLNQQLRLSNVNLPGGSFDLGNTKQNIRVLGQQNTIDDLENLPITGGENRWLYLNEVADVKMTEQEANFVSYLNDKPAMGFSIWRTRGFSDTVVEDKVDAEIAKLQEVYPYIKINKIISLADYTRDSFNTTMQTLIEGAILTILVVYMFLRNRRATLIAAAALPISIIPTFMMMELLDFTLNSVTLLALTLATGILVDDAIVEIENIDRFIEQGNRPYIASLKGADSIGLAVVATTFSIIAIFLPVSFIGGVVGLYFKQFGLTVATSVLVSLFVARLLTPLMSAYFLKPHQTKSKNEKQPKLTNNETEPNEIKPKKIKQNDSYFDRFVSRYIIWLNWVLINRKRALLIAIAFFALSGIAFMMLPTGFLPKPDRNVSILHVQLPPSYTKKQVEHEIEEIAQALHEDPIVRNTLALSDASNKVIFNISLSDDRNMLLSEYEQKTKSRLREISDIRFYFVNEIGFRAYTVLLGSRDPKLLEDTSAELEHQMQQIPYLSDVQNMKPIQRPELLVIPNREQMARLGVTTANLANTLRIANLGDTNSSSAKFKIGDKQIPIRIKLNDADKANLETLGQLRVININGRPVPIASVAQFKFSEGDNTIMRYNRYRQIAIEADLYDTATLGQAEDAVSALPIMKNLPEGVIRFDYGDSQYMNEMLSQFSIAMVFGVLMVYTILVLLFKDLLQPITILVTLPLSLAGAVVGLILIRSPVDLSSVIGLLMLMGIVTKNAILLIDFIIIRRENGMSRHDSILDAGRIRVKPIIMTTIAMIAGMIPAALGFGASADFRVPMAVAVISGLISSTFLSLLVVPIFYTYMDDLTHWLKKYFGGFTSVTKEDIEEGEKLHQSDQSD